MPPTAENIYRGVLNGMVARKERRGVVAHWRTGLIRQCDIGNAELFVVA